MHKTIIEPFRIKSVEPLRRTTLENRRRLLEQAGFNLFFISSPACIFRLVAEIEVVKYSNCYARKA